MKKMISIIFCLSIFSYSQTVQAGLSNEGSYLIVSAKPSSNISGNYSGGVVTVRWLSSYDGTVLTDVNASVGSWEFSQEGSIGSYNYKNFNWVGKAVYPINWLANNIYELFRVRVSGGVGTGTFELTPIGWFADGDWYFEVGGADLTNNSNPFFQVSVNNVPLPVELSSFSIRPIKNSISLEWETKTEINSYQFIVERAIDKISSTSDWKTIGEVKASGNSNSTRNYSFTDKNLSVNRYQYRLIMVDNDGTFKYSETVEAEISSPEEFQLSQNYPNPFNPSTKIDFWLPNNALVTLDVYDLSGQKTTTLISKEMSAGYQQCVLEANQLRNATGVYFYRIVVIDKSSGEVFTDIKKLILLK